MPHSVGHRSSPKVVNVVELHDGDVLTRLHGSCRGAAIEALGHIYKTRECVYVSNACMQTGDSRSAPECRTCRDGLCPPRQHTLEIQESLERHKVCDETTPYVRKMSGNPKSPDYIRIPQTSLLA